MRINYSKLWLALIAPASPENNADRRKYAQLVGNVDSDRVSSFILSPGYTLITFQYPIFEAALTGECSLASSTHELTRSQGRASMGDTPDNPEEGIELSFKRASSMLDQLPQTEQEVEAMRDAVMAKEGLLVSVFDILRNVPRRVLMVFKLNDLTRYGSSLWHAIMLTS